MRKNDFLRIIDVNLNRLREALRVCEEIARFIVEDKKTTKKLKSLRHEILSNLKRSKGLNYSSLIASRDSKYDVGKESVAGELKRKDTCDIMSANLQRAKESVRVLEEFFKIVDRDTALRFKKTRFKIYNIERALIERVRPSSNPR